MLDFSLLALLTSPAANDKVNFMHPRLDFRAMAIVVALPLCGACGDDGEPAPGYPDPCDTAASALLGCPPAAGPWHENPRTIETACQRLVSCGLIAAERKDDNGGDQSLGYAWCVARLQAPGSHGDPCGGRRYTLGEVDAAVDCIHATPCTALGAAFSDKGSDAQADNYQCANGETRRTATVCDHGLLSY